MENYVERKMKSKVTSSVTKVFKILFFILAAIVFVMLFGYVIMWLWNWLMPEIFGLPTLAYWQAVGLLVLAKMLFGGLGQGYSSKNNRKSPKGFQNKFKQRCNGNVSKWQHYDKFWEEEGEKAYEEFIERQEKTSDDA